MIFGIWYLSSKFLGNFGVQGSSWRWGQTLEAAFAQVRFCVDVLGAKRIAHGVLSMEDEELIQHLAKLQICLNPSTDPEDFFPGFDCCLPRLDGFIFTMTSHVWQVMNPFISQSY